MADRWCCLKTTEPWFRNDRSCGEKTEEKAVQSMSNTQRSWEQENTPLLPIDGNRVGLIWQCLMLSAQIVGYTWCKVTDKTRLHLSTRKSCPLSFQRHLVQSLCFDCIRVQTETWLCWLHWTGPTAGQQMSTFITFSDGDAWRCAEFWQRYHRVSLTPPWAGINRTTAAGGWWWAAELYWCHGNVMTTCVWFI